MLWGCYFSKLLKKKHYNKREYIYYSIYISMHPVMYVLISEFPPHCCLYRL